MVTSLEIEHSQLKIFRCVVILLTVVSNAAAQPVWQGRLSCSMYEGVRPNIRLIGKQPELRALAKVVSDLPELGTTLSCKISFQRVLWTENNLGIKTIYCSWCVECLITASFINIYFYKLAQVIHVFILEHSEDNFFFSFKGTGRNECASSWVWRPQAGVQRQRLPDLLLLWVSRVLSSVSL